MNQSFDERQILQVEKILTVVYIIGCVPDFYNWNRVFVRYCDGASFSGNVSLPTKNKVNEMTYSYDLVFVSPHELCRRHHVHLVVEARQAVKILIETFVLVQGKVLQYRGESIWNVVIDDLINKEGMKNADKVYSRFLVSNYFLKARIICNLELFCTNIFCKHRV